AGHEGGAGSPLVARVGGQQDGRIDVFFSSRRRHTRSVSAFLLNRSSDLKLAAERPLKDIRDEYNYPKKKGIKDECSRLLEASTMKSRRGFAIQRLMNAMRQAHADGWFI